MRVLRKFVAFLVYASILMVPGTGTDLRVVKWVRAFEMTSTMLDRTLRRKKSQIENARLAEHCRMTQIADGERQDMTGRIRNGQFVA